MRQSNVRGVAPLPSILKISRGDDFQHEDRTVPDAAMAKKFADATHHEPGAAGEVPNPPGSPPNVLPFAKPRAIAALAATNPNAVVVHDRYVTRDAARSARKPKPESMPESMPKSKPEPKMFDSRGTHPAPTSRTPGRGVAEATTRPVSVMPAARGDTGWTPPRGTHQATVAQIAQVTPWAPPQPSWPVVPSIVPPVVPPAVPPVPQVPAPAPIREVAPAPITSSVVPASIAPPVTAPQPAPYAPYEALGLGAPKASTQRAAKLIVSAYRLLGFSILTIIVVVLVGYIAQTAFFYGSSSWVVPMSVTPSDERVVALQAQLAAQQNTHDKIADELAQAERAITAQQQFQAEFSKAIKSDLEGRRLALGRIRELAASAASTRAQIRNTNSAYAGASRERMAEEYAAGLIDRRAMLSGKFQLAQISTSNLTLAEHQAEFETRAQELEAQARSLDAILVNANPTGDTALSYDVLKIKQEYEASRLELAKSIEQRDTLKASLARQDKIVAALSQSAYLRALHDHATIVSVPYGNLSHVSKGGPLYACKLGMILCHHVGKVIEILPGEVQFKHPHRDNGMRGQLVEVALDAGDADAAADDVLFVGGKPVLL